MDRDEALRLLEGGPEGVAEWNRRREAGEGIPDLRGADLSGAVLRGAVLRGADLSGADLRMADLSGAVLSEAVLSGAVLRGAVLRGADLSGAVLSGVVLSGAVLSGVVLRGVVCDCTIFADVDLSRVEGLSSVRHGGPSTIGIDTLIRSEGKIPEAFLRGCGLPDVWITHLPSLIGAMSPIQFYSVFISYSSKDQDFVDRLYADLQAKGIRCWLDHEHLKIGDEIRDVIEVNIRVHDKLLLALSAHSVASEWVRNEVETALEKERRQGRPVLFPIRLDDAVLEAEAGWAGLVRRRRHIGDFCQWKDHDAYQKAFERMLHDLKAEDSTAK